MSDKLNVFDTLKSSNPFDYKPLSYTQRSSQERHQLDAASPESGFPGPILLESTAKPQLGNVHDARFHRYHQPISP